MKRVTKGTIIASAAALLLCVAGCAGGGSADTGGHVSGNALSKIDPCAIISSEKAVQMGLPSNGKSNTSISSQPGCQYYGDHVGISVYRVAEDTFDEFANRPVWSEFKRLKVNGRDGAEAHLPEDTENDCTTAVSAGGGVVMVNASTTDPRKPFDACAESLKVAKLIEPDLPK